VFADPQVRAREMQIEFQHGAGTPVPLVASPLRLSDTPPQYVSPPPLLGQHTGEVLAALAGIDTGQLAVLRQSGVI
jgi:crotonobetainyl-CoA:carnitine CoA-transferase CaiB-like acyl-CoA transferase